MSDEDNEQREIDEDNPRRVADEPAADEGGAADHGDGDRGAPPPPVRDEPPNPRDLPGVSVLVRNISFDAHEDDIRDKFQAYGNVLDVYMPKDRETGRKRGLAFVKYAIQGEADDAVEKATGMDIMGREVRCEIANERRKNPDEMRNRGGGGYDDRRGGDRRGGYDRRDDRPYAREDRPRGVCYAWRENRCDRGDSCRFAHSEDGGGGGGGYRGGGDRGYGGDRGGDRWGGNRDRGYGGDRGGDRPRGVCFDWQKGRCDRGESCRFAHEGEQRAY